MDCVRGARLPGLAGQREAEGQGDPLLDAGTEVLPGGRATVQKHLGEGAEYVLEEGTVLGR